MSTLEWVVVIGLGMVFVVPTVVAAVMALPMATATVTRCDPELAGRVIASAERAVDASFLEAQGFEVEAAYVVDLRFAKAYFAMWRHGSDATFLAVYSMGGYTNGRWITDLVSELSADPLVSLTTSTARDAHTAPLRPGDHMQTFTNPSLAVLWERHLDAEGYLAMKHHFVPGRVDRTGGDALEHAVRDGSRYRLSHPWVWLTVPYRFWVGRFVWHNRSLRERGV